MSLLVPRPAIAAPDASMVGGDRETRLVDDAIHTIQSDYYQTLDPEVLKAACNRRLQDIDALRFAPADRVAECIEAMFTVLDDASQYLPMQEFQALSAEKQRASLFAGATLKRQGLGIRIAILSDDSALYVSGLRQNDLIEQIAGRAVGKMPLAQIYELLHKHSGDSIAIAYRRLPGTAVHKVTVKRQEQLARAQEIQVRVTSDIAYLRVPVMRREMAEHLLGALKQFPDAPQGWILDLRGCTGGGLTTVLDLIALFTPDRQTIMRIEGRLEDANQALRARDSKFNMRRYDISGEMRDALQGQPLVVLVDVHTVRGAQYAAAALKEVRDAVIVGALALANWQIQTFRQLSADIILKLTTAELVTPLGRHLHGADLEPDHVMQSIPRHDVRFGTNADPAVIKAITLVWGTKVPQSKAATNGRER